MSCGRCRQPLYPLTAVCGCLECIVCVCVYVPSICVHVSVACVLCVCVCVCAQSEAPSGETSTVSGVSFSSSLFSSRPRLTLPRHARAYTALDFCTTSMTRPQRCATDATRPTSDRQTADESSPLLFLLHSEPERQSDSLPRFSFNVQQPTVSGVYQNSGLP